MFFYLCSLKQSLKFSFFLNVLCLGIANTKLAFSLIKRAKKIFTMKSAYLYGTEKLKKGTKETHYYFKYNFNLQKQLEKVI